MEKIKTLKGNFYYLRHMVYLLSSIILLGLTMSGCSRNTTSTPEISTPEERETGRTKTSNTPQEKDGTTEVGGKPVVETVDDEEQREHRTAEKRNSGLEGQAWQDLKGTRNEISPERGGNLDITHRVDSARVRARDKQESAAEKKNENESATEDAMRTENVTADAATKVEENAQPDQSAIGTEAGTDVDNETVTAAATSDETEETAVAAEAKADESDAANHSVSATAKTPTRKKKKGKKGGRK